MGSCERIVVPHLWWHAHELLGLQNCLSIPDGAAGQDRAHGGVPQLLLILCLFPARRFSATASVLDTGLQRLGVASVKESGVGCFTTRLGALVIDT